MHKKADPFINYMEDNLYEGFSLSAASKRNEVVQAVKSRENKNQYTQSVKRTQVASGYSDCSSLTWWAYRQVGVEIGDYTGAQIQRGSWVTKGGSVPEESKLLPGDLLFFSANYENGRPYRVNHVEMYVGNGETSGHGYGVGPTRKNMAKYCQERNQDGRPYIGVKRYIASDGSDENNEGTTPKERMFVGEVTASRLNVRTGPGTTYGNLPQWPILAKTNLVDVLEQVGSWYYIRIAGRYQGYVYAKYIKPAP